jgi:hypothetical protein
VWNLVVSIESFQDQVWFKLKGCNITFGAIYIAASDSTFFRPFSFSNIQEKAIDGNMLLMGDPNARIPTLSCYNDNLLCYSENPDSSINHHGKEMSICNDFDLRPVNHL